VLAARRFRRSHFDTPLAAARRGNHPLHRRGAGQEQQRNLSPAGGGNWYIYSQFEPTMPRRFSLLRRTLVKTPWQLTIRVPEKKHSISNTR